ncbi:hypothetical protein SeLEV6574_g04010 [Synchytrium endobioticum]|uniref:Transmembrane protein n=1 Tax=Synchytrium endobioticum TaxID=286115 RepID=A0A507D1R5_9FUNG|nr:hypothetical protein SeLEV6574_g04010 [Synchytrium endobioticum]
MGQELNIILLCWTAIKCIYAQAPVITFSLSPAVSAIDIGVNSQQAILWTNITTSQTSTVDVVVDGCGIWNSSIISTIALANLSDNGSLVVLDTSALNTECNATTLAVVANTTSYGQIRSNSIQVVVQYAPSIAIASPSNGAALIYMNGFQVGISTNASLYDSATPNFTALIYPPCVPSNYSSYQLVPTFVSSSVIRSYRVQASYPLQAGLNCQVKVIGNDGSSNPNIVSAISVTFVARTLNILEPTNNKVVNGSSFVVKISTDALGSALFGVSLAGTEWGQSANDSLGRFTATQLISGATVVGPSNLAGCAQVIVSADDVSRSVNVQLAAATIATTSTRTITSTFLQSTTSAVPTGGASSAVATITTSTSSSETAGVTGAARSTSLAEPQDSATLQIVSPGADATHSTRSVAAGTTTVGSVTVSIAAATLTYSPWPSSSPSAVPGSDNNGNFALIMAAALGSVGAVAVAGAAAFAIAKSRDHVRNRRLANARVTASGRLVTASGDVLNGSTDLVSASQWGIGSSHEELSASQAAASAASPTNVPERKPQPRRHPPAANAAPVLHRQETIVPTLGSNGHGTAVTGSPLMNALDAPTPPATYLTTQTPRDMPWISIDDEDQGR